MATNALNDSQRRVKRVIDLAMDTCVAYAAKEVPPLGNLTKEGLVEELGRMNEARKAIERTEKILKERLRPMLELNAEVRSDNYVLTYESRSRLALNQTKAKEHLEELGVLADYMDASEVPTMIVKAIA